MNELPGVWGTHNNCQGKEAKMKLTKKDISAKDGSGTVGLKPETPEDLWHAYNLLQTGDLVRCTTIRKVMKETNTGSTSSNKMRMMLTIEVKKVDFDVDSLQLRLSGTNQSENEHVRMGAHHTLTLELGRTFSTEKLCWDQVFLDIIEEACHPEREAEIAAVVMQPGLAHLCMVTGSLTITKAKIEITIPKKRTGSTNHQKAINRFFEPFFSTLILIRSSASSWPRRGTSKTTFTSICRQRQQEEMTGRTLRTNPSLYYVRRAPGTNMPWRKSSPIQISCLKSRKQKMPKRWEFSISL